MSAITRILCQNSNANIKDEASIEIARAAYVLFKIRQSRVGKGLDGNPPTGVKRKFADMEGLNVDAETYTDFVSSPPLESINVR